MSQVATLAMRSASDRASSVGFPALTGFLALFMVLLTLDDPGITIDEPLDVAPGRHYIRLLMQQGPRFFSPDVINATYGNNREHPPLGRWLLGISSVSFEPIEVILRGADPTGLYVRAGRVAPAAAFAALVFAISRWAGSVSGPAAALASGLSVLFMPRVFAHAHLAALDTFVALTWTLAFLSAVNYCESRRWKPFLLVCMFTGLALLTKIHGWLLVPAMVCWLVIRRPGWRAASGLMKAFSVSFLIFFLGWPWLWIDPVGRLLAYFRTGVDRVSIRVLYFGTVYQDIEVPWHYPWFYTLTTVPVVIVLLALVGGWKGWKSWRTDQRPRALTIAVFFWLLLFSTNAPVYDGERLYLPVFPMVAILAGLGFADLWLKNQVRWIRVVLTLVLLLQSYGGLSYHPFQLSYFNWLVGGLPGAERLGLELTYWGDAVDDRLLNELAQRADTGSTVVRVPTLAPSQGLQSTTRPLMAKELLMKDQQERGGAEWIVLDRRTAYWPGEISAFVQENPPMFLRYCHGVWLSGIWKGPIGKNADSN